MLLATALALLILGCAQQTFTVQNKPAAVAPKETITHHFFVSGIGQKKTVDAAKICGGAENVVKTETQRQFANGPSFCCWLSLLNGNIVMQYCMIAMFRNDYLLVILACRVYWCFCIMIALSGGKTRLTAERCLPVRGEKLSTPEAWWLRTD